MALNDLIIKRISHNIPEFDDIFIKYSTLSSGIIIFGSYAIGCENRDSDVDILFIGKGRRIKTKKLDFIWVHPDKIYKNSWLGSELAHHIAKYGLWLKGDDEWRRHTFISKTAITRKKERIYNNLIHIFLKRHNLYPKSLKRLFLKIYIDFYRLWLLEHNIAIPPKQYLLSEVISYQGNIILEITDNKYLGSIARNIMEEIFESDSFDKIDSEIKALISDTIYLNNYI